MVQIERFKYSLKGYSPRGGGVSCSAYRNHPIGDDDQDDLGDDDQDDLGDDDQDDRDVQSYQSHGHHILVCRHNHHGGDVRGL